MMHDGETDVTPVPKITQKGLLGLTRTVNFEAWPPKTQPKSPRTGGRLKDHAGSRKYGLPAHKIVIL
jgi:hypothetical protein